MAETVKQTDEFKLIIDNTEAIEEYVAALAEHTNYFKKDCIFWLHPEWSLHNNLELLNTITEWIKVNGAPYRAGWQLHKNYAADLLDQRSVPAAPLGGIPEKGF